MAAAGSAACPAALKFHANFAAVAAGARRHRRVDHGPDYHRHKRDRQLQPTSSQKEISHLAELGVALLDQLLRRQRRQLIESRAQASRAERQRPRPDRVRAFARFGDDAVDQPELQQIRRGELERGGGFFGARGSRGR